MPKICFVSYEFHPTTWGGCGVLIRNACQILLAKGHDVVLLLDIAAEEFDRFMSVDRKTLPRWKHCKAYLVGDLIDAPLGPSAFGSTNEWKAYRFHVAAKKVADLERPDVMEFFDYCGPAFYAIRAKLGGMAYEGTSITVRVHNSIEVMDSSQATAVHDYGLYRLFALEHGALQFADAVLYPSERYMRHAYLPFYEKWRGSPIHSKPPLVIWPKKSAGAHENIVAFYGRIFGWKGVDVFVDAAVNYLAGSGDSGVEFYIIGYDSNLPPDRGNSYVGYLKRKIPTRFRHRFVFTGQLSWQELEALMPRLLFAVFPSYFESFCYAAHELYAAGIPLVVSDIPAFREYFEDGKNALVFDGSISGLTASIKKLIDDTPLRRSISTPYPLNNDPLGDFYDRPAGYFKGDDMQATRRRKPRVLLVVLTRDAPLAETMIRSIRGNEGTLEVRLVYGEEPSGTEGVSCWWLGRNLVFRNPDGDYLLPTDITTHDYLLILEAGDTLDDRFLVTCVGLLEKRPDIGFVGSWREIPEGTGSRKRTDTFPVDAMLETIPFIGRSPLSRHVIRTEPGKLLLDAFDNRLGIYSELGFLWSLEDHDLPGITLPEVLMSCRNEEPVEDRKAASYLVLKDNNPFRKKRLARFLVAVSTLADKSGSGIESQISANDRILVDVLVPLAAKLRRFSDRHGLARRFLKTVYKLLYRGD